MKASHSQPNEPLEQWLPTELTARALSCNMITNRHCTKSNEGEHVTILQRRKAGAKPSTLAIVIQMSAGA
jgi:hypothetical protein